MPPPPQKARGGAFLNAVPHGETAYLAALQAAVAAGRLGLQVRKMT